MKIPEPNMALRGGFTLVELMIVVAIIGVLASLAIPNFVEMQYRAKRAEAPANVAGIKTATIAYESVHDNFLRVKVHPPSDPDKKSRSWKGGNPDFVELGWAPDGHVRGQYSVSTAKSDFTVNGVTDVDDDQNDAVYTATRSVVPIFLNNNDTY